MHPSSLRRNLSLCSIVVSDCLSACLPVVPSHCLSLPPTAHTIACLVCLCVYSGGVAVLVFLLHEERFLNPISTCPSPEARSNEAWPCASISTERSRFRVLLAGGGGAMARTCARESLFLATTAFAPSPSRHTLRRRLLQYSVTRLIPYILLTTEVSLALPVGVDRS